MRILPDPVSFDWDKGNIDKNLIKHNVTLQEAEQVFGNEPLIVAEDASHSRIEKRYWALGKANSRRLLFVSFTIRKDKVRIISIRDMNRKEKNRYEKA